MYRKMEEDLEKERNQPENPSLPPEQIPSIPELQMMMALEDLQLNLKRMMTLLQGRG